MSNVVSVEPTTRGVEWLRRAAYRFVNERTALPLALVLAVLSSIGDAATSAESAFTLIYLLPIALVTWFRGVRTSYLVIAVAAAGSLITDVYFSRFPAWPSLIAWNVGGEVLLFFVYAHTLGALRGRIDAEVHLRKAALGQLRHSERLNTIGKLASGVAHELGTPLNVIAGRAELVIQGRLSPAEEKRSAKIIVEQSEKMAVIIRKLLEFASRGGADAHDEEIRALCARTSELLTPLARQGNVSIDVTGDKSHAAVNTTEFQQVLSNLVSNAMAAMPNGGHLGIDVHRVETTLVENDDRTPRPYVCIEVRDQGSGIAPEVLPHVFDPFFTTKPVGEGTGLGLSVSYGIVRDHGGAMRVSTTLGKGTTVAVYLPALT